MGQKITEHPQVDYWVQLAREADRSGARLGRRRSSDKRELEQFGEMQRARTRAQAPQAIPGGAPDADPGVCVGCGAPLPVGHAECREVRAIYGADGVERFYRCPACAGAR